MKGIESQLSNLFTNRPLNLIEREKRSGAIIFDLASLGGVILAISCKDGILLAGINPTNEKTIFQVFHRIGLLGIGKDSDCEDIHGLARSLAFGTGLAMSKGDISANDISKKIAQEVDNAFSYLSWHREPSKLNMGPYKANFIITEVGFDPEEDFIDFITFYGERSYKRQVGRGLWAMSELPRLVEGVIYQDVLVQEPAKDKKDKTKKNGEKDEVKIKQIPLNIVKVDPEYHPIIDGLGSVIDEFYSQDNIWTIKEAALFAGLTFYILDERGGQLEMAYLDREMLKKTKTEERRFHHIWKWITNPNPYKLPDSWQAWRRFVAPVYNKVKRGELYPEQKFIIDIFEDLKKKGFDKRDELKKMKKQELAKLIADLLGTKQQENQ